MTFTTYFFAVCNNISGAAFALMLISGLAFIIIAVACGANLEDKQCNERLMRTNRCALIAAGCLFSVSLFVSVFTPSIAQMNEARKALEEAQPAKASKK